MFDNLATAPDWLIEANAKPKPKNDAPKQNTSTSTLVPLSHQQTENGDRYAEAALIDECKNVSIAPSGTRNDVLNSAAFSLGQFVASGLLSADEVRQNLITAATQCGLVNDDGLASAQATIESGIVAGQQSPRELPEPSVRGDLRYSPADDEKGEITAIPFDFRDVVKIPRREFLYGTHLIRKFISVTVAPGGVGKSALLIVEALDMATGKQIFGWFCPEKELTVWLFNLEDPRDELDRRVMASCLKHKITKDDIGGRLYVNSGREQPLVIAETTREGARIVRPVVNALINEIKRRNIDVLIVDPFVSCHNVNENDNSSMDMVVKEWNKVAEAGNCAIELIHHTRKLGDARVSTEAARGAKALTDAARSVRIINGMTEKQGLEAGVDNHRNYFQTYTDKSNMAPPANMSRWFKIEGVDLMNGSIGLGDNVGVVVPWQYPDAFDGVTKTQVYEIQQKVAAGEYRKDPQSPGWVGHVVAEVLDLDLGQASEKMAVKTMIKTWLGNKVLLEETRSIEGRDRPFVVVGELITASPSHEPEK